MHSPTVPPRHVVRPPPRRVTTAAPSWARSPPADAAGARTARRSARPAAARSRRAMAN
ncbi:hypothetical protein Zm00014a_026509 [Zea mays]|uniref:Uncharacterized protein n=1 Tax=Zea mays TaxID=4577 RepID=A0A3L6DQ47_MAIZE|nr:hypothetical protein Zm00014a_026509 [Zea mays]